MTMASGLESRVAGWGWGILLAVATLLFLNGAVWLFVGPDMSVEEMAADTGVATAEFEQTNPAAYQSVGRNARQVAVWFIAFGLLAFMVALAGFRLRSGWAWRASWVLAAAPAGVGLTQLVGDGGAFAFASLVLSAVAVVGQLLARPRQADRVSSGASPASGHAS